MIQLDDGVWRILRRALKGRSSKSGVPYRALRNWVRQDLRNVAKLIRMGLMEHVEADRFRITSAGIEAADMGEVSIEWSSLRDIQSQEAITKLADTLSSSVMPDFLAGATASPPPAGPRAGRSGPGSSPARMSGSRTAGRV